MDPTVKQNEASKTSLVLMPIMATVFVVFLITGAALPVLPLYIYDDLGFGTFTVGLVSGAQFAASLVSRLWAGSFSDRSGPKAAVVAGLSMATTAGVLYLLSFMLTGTPVVSIGVLILGRALLGGAESFVIVGAQSWGLAVVRSEEAGKAIGWIGTALYVALAVGAPLGSLLSEAWGFIATGIVTLVIPLATMIVVLPMQVPRAPPRGKVAILAVAKAVWLPGMGMAFASLGYGAMIAFCVLYFSQQGWEPAWLPFTVFAVAFILVRVLIGSLPNRIGGGSCSHGFRCDPKRWDGLDMDCPIGADWHCGGNHNGAWLFARLSRPRTGGRPSRTGGRARPSDGRLQRVSGCRTRHSDATSRTGRQRRWAGIGFPHQRDTRPVHGSDRCLARRPPQKVEAGS